jgi:hypothetical protein
MRWILFRSLALGALLLGMTAPAAAFTEPDAPPPVTHSWRGDLTVNVVAPDGSACRVHNRSGGSADNINTTYTVNASAETANSTVEPGVLT